MSADDRGGLVLVDKPSDWTSHDVVARCRRLAATRRVGHAGTLDPMATGVLVLGVGRATRLLGHLQLADKAYRATIRLGQSTVTDDAEGEITGGATAAQVTDPALTAAVADLTGDIMQVPSSVSAIKVNGVRSYARVRSGSEVALAARPVTVRRFDVLATHRLGDLLDVEVDVACTSGTYIRALARDLGVALGTGGHLTALRRTRVGSFGLDLCHTLDALAERWQILPLDEVARAAFTAIDLTDDAATEVRFGRALPREVLPPGESEPVAVFAPDGTFLALYERRGDQARALAVFV